MSLYTTDLSTSRDAAMCAGPTPPANCAATEIPDSHSVVRMICCARLAVLPYYSQSPSSGALISEGCY